MWQKVMENRIVMAVPPADAAAKGVFVRVLICVHSRADPGAKPE
jgi:hypothetical protein